LFAHCFTCGKDGLAAVRISRAMAGLGIGVLRFDFAGLGQSEGAFEETSFSLNVSDVVAAGLAMSRAGMAPTLLVGHSLGGAAVLAAASELASVCAIATIAAPFDVAHILQHVGRDNLARIDSEGEASLSLGGHRVTIGRQLLIDLAAHDQAARIAALRRPLLILHAPLDQTVDIENASRIFLAARHSKSFISLDDADHLLSRPSDAERVATLISAWAAHYLPAVRQDTGDRADALAEETGLGKYQLAMHSGGNRWLADEPDDVAPSRRRQGLADRADQYRSESREAQGPDTRRHLHAEHRHRRTAG
jgi:fermentation-respiration switch protein FrsA (DUF1100 family)